MCPALLVMFPGIFSQRETGPLFPKNGDCGAEERTERVMASDDPIVGTPSACAPRLSSGAWKRRAVMSTQRVSLQALHCLVRKRDLEQIWGKRAENAQIFLEDLITRSSSMISSPLAALVLPNNLQSRFSTLPALFNQCGHTMKNEEFTFKW
jgi:hypothetical protein